MRISDWGSDVCSSDRWMGGLASASFYVPYRGIRRGSWEVFWLVGGIFSWVFAPWIMASIQTNDLFGVMAQIPGHVVGLCILFGILWGFGGLTYGLTMRYLGLSLGMAVVLGLCTVFGTLIPPIVQGDFEIGRASCRERGCQYVYLSV